MLVGLVPAAIVGWFAYYANDDYRTKQILIVRKTAEAISFRAASVVDQNPKALESDAHGSHAAFRARQESDPGSDRAGIEKLDAQFGPGLPRRLVDRQDSGVEASEAQTFDWNPLRIDDRYNDVVKEASGRRICQLQVGPRFGG